MSREFSRAMEQAAKDTGVTDVARDLKASTSVKGMGLDKMREAADKFEKWDPIKNAAKPSVTMPARTLTPPPMPPALPMTLVPAVDEVDEDLAAIAEADAAPQIPAPTIHGPETKALYDKQALRAKVLAEQTEKLKAIEAGTYAPEPVAAAEPAPVAATEPAKPAPRKRTVKPKADTDTAAAPKAPRKKKADNA
jgi:sec-independent protein translocase protein TatB